MKCILAGSRGIVDLEIVKQAISSSGIAITELVSGGARGVDTLGEMWAKENSIPIKVFKPDWNTYGKAAGPLRNIQMGDYAEALIACWDGKSKGTNHMIDYATSKGLKVYVHLVVKE